jgi:hypothetical protein
MGWCGPGPDEWRSAAPQQAVIPAHAGTQYAAASRFHHWRLGILGRPAKPGDNGGKCCALNACYTRCSLRYPARALMAAASEIEGSVVRGNLHLDFYDPGLNGLQS